MKLPITLVVLFFSVLQLCGQAPPARKLVELKSTNSDSVVESKVKRDKSGQITSLYQTVKTHDGQLVCIEDYVKGKRWELSEFLDQQIIHTSMFTPEGLISASYYGSNDAKQAIDANDSYRSYTYQYYSNLKLKFKIEERVAKTKKGAIAEKVFWEPWNVVEYYYPDGKPYTDWGTLKDGVGYYNVLDDTGKLCVPCTDKVKKRAAENAK